MFVVKMVVMTIVSQVVTMVVAVVNVTYSVLRICRQDRTRFQDVRQHYVNLAGGAFSKVLLSFPLLLNIEDEVEKKKFKRPSS